MARRGGPGMGKPEKAKNFKKAMRDFLVSLKPMKFAVFGALILAVLMTVFGLVAPTIVKKMSETIIIGGSHINMRKIAYYGFILIALYVISALAGWVCRVVVVKISAKITQKYRSEISIKINKLPLKYFDSHAYGDVLSRVTNDAYILGQSLSDSMGTIVVAVVTVVGCIIMMLINSPLLTGVLFLLNPISLLVVLILVKFSQKYFVRKQKELGNINGQIEEIYSAHNVVRVFNGEAKAQSNFDKTNSQLFKSGYKAQALSGLMHPIMNLMGNLIYVVICLVGAWKAIKDGNPVFAATIVTFITYMRRFNNEVSNIAQISGTLQSTAAAAERIFDFLNEEEQEEEHKEKQLKEVKGNVEFKHVKFGYNADKEIIHDFSASIKAGQKIAIVGPTGAGKTTIVNLLMRFYEVNDGEILIDGVPTKNMSREEVRSCFGMVLQDAWLFDGTIRDNISYGHEELSKEEVENACCTAHVDHFIRALPEGYDMVIDEKANISQGMKQLLTIARAMVHNAPMLILDEATSSVDTRTEILIQNAMDKMSKGKTSFIIAHRLSTIKNADLILVMKEGNIVEQVTHEQLLARGGFYKELYNSQFDDEEE